MRVRLVVACAGTCLVIASSGQSPARADTFIYDSLNRLVRAERGDVAESYRYDGGGQLLRRCTVRSGTTLRCADMLVDASSSLSRVVGEAGPEGTKLYVRGPMGADLLDSPEGPRFALPDWSRSVVAEIDAAGRLVGRRAYDARGEVRRWVGDFTSPLGYRGELQSEARLVYLRARSYDPQVGRFLQRDVFPGFPGRTMSWNRFAYADADPVNRWDPSGLFSWPTIVLSEEEERSIQAMIGASDAFLDGWMNLPAHSINLFTWSLSPIDRALGYEPRYLPTYKYLANAREAYGTAVPGLEESDAYKFGELAMGVYTLGKLAVVLGAKGVGRVFSVVQGNQPIVSQGLGNATIGATQAPNRIYSARELVRRAAEPGPFHNFPESFNKQIIEQGTKTVTPNFFRQAKAGLSNDSVMYQMRGTVNGVEGTFEIAARPSVSGRTEVIVHRFFRPHP